MKRGLIAAAFLLAAACTADAKLAISDGWTRETAPGQTTAVAYLTITNTGGADTLMSASSPVAQQVTIHSMSMDKGIMRMRDLDSLPVGSHAKVTLESGGTHLMLTGLKAPLKAGDSVPLTLTFDRSGDINTMLNVRGAMSAMDMAHDHAQ